MQEKKFAETSLYSVKCTWSIKINIVFIYLDTVITAKYSQICGFLYMCIICTNKYM